MNAQNEAGFKFGTTSWSWYVRVYLDITPVLVIVVIRFEQGIHLANLQIKNICCSK